MPIEQNVQYIDDLNAANPPATDPLSQVDDHLRLIKTAVKQSFPNVNGAVTATHTVLNGLDGRVTAVEGRDITAIKDNSGTPELVSGITAAEIRNLIDLGPLDSPTFSTTVLHLSAEEVTGGPVVAGLKLDTLQAVLAKLQHLDHHGAKEISASPGVSAERPPATTAPATE